MKEEEEKDTEIKEEYWRAIAFPRISSHPRELPNVYCYDTAAR